MRNIKVCVNDLEVGNLFIFDDYLYQKISDNGLNNVFNLHNGEVETLYEMSVRKVNLELRIKE